MGKRILRLVKRVFTRPVRVALYVAAIGAVGTLVGTGDLPAWTLAPVSPLLLALLNITPADVEAQQVAEDPDGEP